MTQGSRSGRGGWGAHPGSRPLAWIILAWHAGCMMLGNSGCFVTWELPYAEPENQPPEFGPLGWEAGEPLVMDREWPMYAIAQDPDSEAPIVFSWTAGGEILFDEPFQDGDGSDGQAIVWVSPVVIPYNTEFDGKLLHCTIYDGEGATDTVSWPLEVL